MASPTVNETEASASSRENITGQMPTTDKGPPSEKHTQKRRQSQVKKCYCPNIKRGDGMASDISSAVAQSAPALAASLVKFIKVSGMTKPTDTDPSAYQDKPAPVLTKPGALKEPSQKKVSITEALQVVGNEGVNTLGCSDARPNWTATKVDMAKDLIHNKMTIARGVTSNRGEQRPHRSSLIEKLAHLPFHTILIKWKMSFHFPAYTPRIVFGILSRFGRIDMMAALSGNSAFVVFHHEYHACRAIMSQQVGFSYCPLILRWWYIQRYKFPLTDAEDVKREDLLLSDGRLERNSKRHIAQIKREFWRKAAALSYDVSTFRP